MISSQKKPIPLTAYEKPAVILLIAVWFGLAIGIGEVTIRAVQKFFLHQHLFQSPYIVWMAPLTDIILCCLAGLILIVSARCWPRLASLSIAVCFFAFLGFLGVFIAYPRLYRWAALLLAGGLAIQTARIITAHAERFYRLVRATTLWLFVIVIGLSVGVHGREMLSERRALAALPPSADKPNVLLIALDTVRAQNLSLYSYPRSTTPNLERLANTGVVFDRAMSTSPWTLPSFSSMFTGRFPHEHRAALLTPLDDTYPTLAEVFNINGHVTGGFVANLLYCTREMGLHRGFVHYEDYPISLGMVLRSSWLGRAIARASLKSIFANDPRLVVKSADQVNREFLSWLNTNHQRPFFAWLNYFDAHAPYLPPEPFDTKFGPKRNQPAVYDMSYRRVWSPKEIQVELDAYDGAIAYIDHQIGLLLDELQRRNVLENTVVIITSDHGEQFGEHGLFDHGNSLYRQLLHVPLLISFPQRIPEGIRVRHAVSLADLPATIVDLAELENGPRMPGNSLQRYWARTHPSHDMMTPLLSEQRAGIRSPEWHPISKGDMKSLVTNRWHYILNGDGREELYDFEQDPLEIANLAHDETNQLTLKQFRLFLKKMLARSTTNFFDATSK